MGVVDREREVVTLKTIAERLGVSRTTVSNAYSKPDQLTPELRERILAVARELGYAGPNPTARSLRRGKSGAIGVLFTDVLSYAFIDPAAVLFLQGVAEAFEQAGLSLLLLPAKPERDMDPSPVYEAVVDGFLIYSVPEDDPRLEAVRERGLRTVSVDQPNVAGAATVNIDDYGGARASAEHLLALGHQHVAVIAFDMLPDGFQGQADLARQAAMTFTVTGDRLTGYMDALQHHGIDWSTVRVEERSPSSRRAGFEAATAVLDQPERPTAILAMSDQLALGALDAARDRGIRVPEELSIVGFDDVPAAARSTPPLTTVRQSHLDKGRTAGQLIVDGWDGEPPQIVLPTEIVVRSSTGLPPQR